MAACTARRLARAGLRTLIISTDPAHSLTESLGAELGGNVEVLEADLTQPAGVDGELPGAVDAVGDRRGRGVPGRCHQV